MANFYMMITFALGFSHSIDTILKPTSLNNRNANHNKEKVIIKLNFLSVQVCLIVKYSYVSF